MRATTRRPLIVRAAARSPRPRGLLSAVWFAASLAASLVAGALVAGCVDQAELPRGDVESQLPLFESAADYEGVSLQAAAVQPCPDGAAAVATFSAPNQVFGLAVALAADATLTVAAQGDPTLDTILAVYGPDDGTGYYGRLPIAVDDDSGEGWLSRLTTTVDDAGNYFVVVTTAGGLGRGPVTLVLTASPCAAGCTDDSACDDGDACTTDRCDAVTAACVHTPIPGCGAGCSDDSVCDDGNRCTIDTCDAATGSCVSLPVADGTACDDGDPTTAGAVCTAGVCLGGCRADAECFDANPCTVDICDAATGACAAAYMADGAACNDDDPCTGNDVCMAGQCLGAALDCNDGNDCTVDACDAAAGCVHVIVDGAACSDGDPATTDDVCLDGVCRGTGAIDCDDGNDCTLDTFHPGVGACIAQPLPDGTACDDGDPTTTGAVCTAGVCGGAVGGDCDDANECTADSDDPATGQCLHVALANGTACNDGDPCTTGDRCVSGACTPLASAADGATCDDGDVCTVLDLCLGGTCTGATRDCDDGDVCTADLCDAVAGCFHTDVPRCDVPCRFDSDCVTGEVCLAETQTCRVGGRGTVTITNPRDGQRIDARVDPTTGGWATSVALVVDARATGATSGDWLAVATDAVGVTRVPATSRFWMQGPFTCGPHLVRAWLEDAERRPWPGAEDLVRFSVSCLCNTDAECASDDPCPSSVCLGGVVPGGAFGSCRYDVNAADPDCCGTAADCRVRDGLPSSGADWLCADVDGDEVGDCVECVTDADCDLCADGECDPVARACHGAGRCVLDACQWDALCTDCGTCDDGDACTEDFCDAATGECLAVVPDPTCGP